MAVSPEWFCGVFSELKSVNVVIVNELGVLKHTKKVEVEGPLQQLKSVKNEILKVLGIKSLSKTVISLAIPSTSFQMFVDNESIDTEYLEWKASMFAGNMGSRLVSNQSTFPFSNASMRSEEVLPWKNAIQQERASQVWHRDQEDWEIFKVFINFNWFFCETFKNNFFTDFFFIKFVKRY